jgi:hypothetical protein
MSEFKLRQKIWRRENSGIGGFKMKKFAVFILLILTCILFVGCVFDSVSYCPYCKSMSIEKVEGEDNVYKCNKCTKTFGAMKK